MDGTICGRACEIRLAGFASKTGSRGKPRYIVAGVTHSKGAPIRFKSAQRAENHIRNMKMVVVTKN